MSLDTKIEWADHTANFWEGCTQVSPACDFCYAKARAERYGSVEWNGPPRKVAAGLKVVRAAQRIAVETGVKQFVFVNSLSDFFDNKADPTWRLWAVHEMMHATDCIFLLLTKRIGNVVSMMNEVAAIWPPNFWLGITVVNQVEADRDIPKLHAAKVALHIPRIFLSVEPMLGPIDLSLLMMCMGDGSLDWVICGGESGSKQARPMHPEWAKGLEQQCQAAGVPFMFKQWGDWTPLTDRSGGHWPADAGGCIRLRYDGTRGDDGEPMQRVGKSFAGRRLDGAEHNGRPQP